MLGGFVLMQLSLFMVMALPGRDTDRSWYGLPSPAALAAMVDSIEEAGPARANMIVESYDGSLFSVDLAGGAPEDYYAIPEALRDVARSYRNAIRYHNVIVDGGPGRLNRLLGMRARPLRFLAPLRVTIWLRDGRVLIVTGRPSQGMRAFLRQRNILGASAGALLFLLLLVAVRQATRPLVRLTKSVQAFGSDLTVPDAKVEGSREVRDLAGAFNDMKQRIGGLVEQRTFLLAGIAHDLRTYLTRLRLRADFIADDDQRVRTERDLDDMAALIDDSLLFAGIDRAAHGDPVAIDLAALSRAFACARTDAERVHVGDAGPVIALGVETGLARIFNNLVDNGLRHGANVLVSVSHRDGHAEWRFDDDGPGVPEGRLAILGQAFARIDPSRDRRTGGAGLGLAIVRALAEAMGGGVAFARSDKGGLRVTVNLPCVEQRA